MIDFNYTIIIQFLNLIVVLILLHFLLFKPILKAINRREQTITSSFDRVKSTSDDARKFETTYEEGTKERRKPVLEARDVLIADAHTVALKMIEQARSELTADLTRIREEIATESRKVFDTLKQDVDRLSLGAAEKIVKRSLR
jgi:F-type H+-transporting ATPase subunit b